MRVHLLQMFELPEHQVEVLLGPREAPLRLQQGRVEEQPDGGERRPPILTLSRNKTNAPALAELKSHQSRDSGIFCPAICMRGLK